MIPHLFGLPAPVFFTWFIYWWLVGRIRIRG